ncbi:MAG: type II toxin-antitoxin system RelE family toxin [Smithella sp.]
MAFNITYKKSVARDINHLDKKEARGIINKIENNLVEYAESYPVLKGEFSGLRKMRVGDYRVVYTIIDKNILILRIGHRREFTKKKYD